MWFVFRSLGVAQGRPTSVAVETTYIAVVLIALVQEQPAGTAELPVAEVTAERLLWSVDGRVESRRLQGGKVRQRSGERWVNYS